MGCRVLTFVNNLFLALSVSMYIYLSSQTNNKIHEHMNNFILISRTYACVTPESAEYGDFSRTGFITEREEFDFRKLVKLMEEHYHPSKSGTGVTVDKDTWFTCEPFTSDYGTCETREESIHFHRDNTPNAEKYWKLAHKIANA